MIAFLLVFSMFQRGIPVIPRGNTVTGVLRTAAGEPASKVRVAATYCTAGVADAPITLVSIAETDETGRFKLEDVPPGRYCILAGSLDSPTFYPGTLEMAKGASITVSPNVAVSDIDFTIENSSYPPLNSGSPKTPTVRINLAIRVIVEGEENPPLSADGQPATIRFTSNVSGNDSETPLSGTSLVIPIIAGLTDEYRVRVERVPQGYSVKSVTFKDTDLTTTPLKASVENLLYFQQPLQIVTFGGPGPLQQTVDRAMQRLVGFKGLTVVLSRARP